MNDNQDKLKEVVGRGIDGGWTCDGGIKYIDNWTGANGRIIGWSRTNEGNRYTHRDYSLPDLIADKGFMGAVYGEEKMCPIYNIKTPVCRDCTCHFARCVPIPASLYHAIEATKLFHSGGDAIGYLYENMPEVKK